MKNMVVGSVTEQVVVDTDIPLLKTENGEQSFMLDAQTRRNFLR